MARPSKLNSNQIGEIITKLNSGEHQKDIYKNYGYTSAEAFSRALKYHGIEHRTVWGRAITTLLKKQLDNRLI